MTASIIALLTSLAAIAVVVVKYFLRKKDPLELEAELREKRDDLRRELTDAFAKKDWKRIAAINRELLDIAERLRKVQGHQQ